MASNIAEKIKERQRQVKELAVTIEVYAMKPVSLQVKAKERELRERLDFRLAELEVQALDTKIKIMKELISILK